jgi:polygalacturonase
MYKLLLITSSLFLSLNALNIDDFGAIWNDTSYEASIANGQAFNSALKAANSGSDRAVTIEAGKVYTMLPAGGVDGLVNVTIQLDGEIYAWGGPESDWPVDQSGGVLALISLTNTQGLVVTGTGLIDGQGYRWWWTVILTTVDNRPDVFDLTTAKDTLIEGITVKNAPQYHLCLDDVLNLTVQNVIIHVDVTDDESFLDWLPTFPLNTDGIDVRGRDIVFRNLTIQNFDDAVAVKPTRTFRDVYSNCTENLLIENCNVKYGVGMSIGSVPPNNDLNCINNVTIRNINFQTPLKAIYIKPNPGTNGKGLISNILYENIYIFETLWWSVWIGPQQQDQPGGHTAGCSFFFPLPGTVCNTDPLVTMHSITLRNVSIYGGVFSPGVLLCNSTNPCTNFLFDRVNVYDRSYFPVIEGFYCDNVQGTAINSNLSPECFRKAEENKEFLISYKFSY